MTGTLSFRYKPARSSADRICYAALSEMGIGTGHAAVIDQKSGRAVRFMLATVTLVHDIACVKCESEMYADGLHLGVLPDGRRVWVRDVRDVMHEAEEQRDYATGATGDTAA